MNNIYTDLNIIPAFNWLQATETKTFSWLVIDSSKEFKEEQLPEAFKLLNAQMIDVLGISDQYLNYLHKIRAYNIAKAKWLITSNNFDFTLMKIAETDLEATQKLFQGVSNKQADKIHAERVLGFRIPLKEISAVEYYAYIKEADKIARSLSAKK